MYIENPISLGSDVLLASAVVAFNYLSDGTTPSIEIVEDNAHAQIGVSNAYIDGDGNLRIDSSKPGPVISALAVADDQLAGRGITCGITGGGPGSIVHFADPTGRKLDLRVPADYDLLAQGASNIWFEIKWYVGPGNPLG